MSNIIGDLKHNGLQVIITSDRVLHQEVNQTLDKVLQNQPLTPVAPLENPVFTGNPTAPTQPQNQNNQRLATTAFVHTAIEQARTTLSEGGDALDIANRIYTGKDLHIHFASEINTAPHHGNVWAWIQRRIQNNDYSGINVGDFIPLTVSGVTMQMEVAGINTYTRSGSPEIPNHIDFISRDLWPDPVQWNLVNFNNGIAGTPSPYLTSNIFAWLNSLQMTVPNGTGANPATTTVDYRTTGLFHRLPAQLRDVIIQKRLVIPTRHTSGVVLTADNSNQWGDMGNLWLPFEVEVAGKIVHGSFGTESTGTSNGQGIEHTVQYPIFAENAIKRIKRTTSGGRGWWWLATVSGGVSSAASRVGSNGRIRRNSAGLATGRVPLCFRIA